MDYHNPCYGCFADKGDQNPCPYCGYAPDNSPGTGLYLSPGTLLFGKYLVGRVLGQGGFGITYLGWDTNLDIRIAIKEFFPQGLVSRLPGENSVISYTGEIKEQFSFGVESFLRESKTLARFEHHPNIVNVRDFFKENNTAYMVMSFVEGITLLEYLKRSGGKIPVEQAVQIILPVTDALKEVHKAGIMHRDISPDNIFIDRGGRIVLIDFGAARQEMREKSKSLSVILKAGYAPEEQYRSKGKQGPWTDIYAIGATLYRTITGETPSEAMDRLAEDDLKLPSELGVEIDPGLEQVLIKALAVNAVERFQTVEEFQTELLDDGFSGSLFEGYKGAKSKQNKVEFKAVESGNRPIASKPAKQADAGKRKDNEKLPQQTSELPEGPKSGAFSVSLDQAVPSGDTNNSNSKRPLKNVLDIVLGAVIVLALIMLASVISYFWGGEENTDPAFSGAEDIGQVAESDFVAALDAVYHIDYENGTIPIGELPIGARVVDPGWEWEYRLGFNYSDIDWRGNHTLPGEGKPVTWIVVARGHYEGLVPHVTLLSEELIGRHAFDNSSHVTKSGYNNWGESGTHSSADYGLRPWLNSTGIHADEGFYRAFSESFKNAVLITDLPNREWQNGSAYNTQDKVFTPSTTELGDSTHGSTYQIGTIYPYFKGAGDAKRITLLDGEARWYWTRSPASTLSTLVHCVSSSGAILRHSHANDGYYGVRPALNLRADTLVSEIRN